MYLSIYLSISIYHVWREGSSHAACRSYQMTEWRIYIYINIYICVCTYMCVYMYI